MYTIHGKANDRFGFEARGSFRVAYKGDSLITTICSGVIIVWIILMVINIIAIKDYLSTPAIGIFDPERLEALDREAYAESQGMTDDALDIVENKRDLQIASSDDPKLMNAISAGFMGMSTNFIGIAFGLFALIFMLIAYFIIMTIVRKGREFRFKADDKLFTITYPKKKKERLQKIVEIPYHDILGLTWRSRWFPLLHECYDITVKTRTYGDLEYRMILTKLARTNGIIETPFNIIREKIGIAAEDEKYMLNQELL